MLRTDRPRVGLTLTEVLIAMFVMAIGMIAIFTLFPLGAIKIGQALKDDRCSQTATQADAYMRSYWRSEVVRKIQAGQQVTEPFYGAMGAANAPLTPPASGYTGTVGGPTPSFPVLIDPLGYQSRSGGDQRQVAATMRSSNPIAGVYLLPRRQLLAVTTPATALRVAGMTDDLTFAPNGSVLATATEPMTRQGRYTWAALVQRVNSTQRDTEANLTVLVFDGRSRLPALSSTNPAYNDEAMLTPVDPLTAGALTATIAGGTTRQITVAAPARTADDPLLVREGGWVMHVTMTDTPPFATEALFYRVVALTDNGNGTTTLDLDRALRNAIVAGAPLQTSQLYFFAGLSEVFERAPLGP